MYSSQLVTLIQQHKISHAQFKNWDKEDKIKHLSPLKREGWKKILSSVATTEALENTLMTELKKAYQGKEDLLAYLSSHQLDEHRHHENINKYLLNTFNYKKTKRTFSDKIIYDIIFPKITKIFSKNPLFGLGLLLFFEIYGVHFYTQFKEKAKQDGLHELVSLINQIEKDEHRHISGVRILLSKQKLITQINKKDKILFKFLLSIVIIDLNMSFWALHNREVRKHIFYIGLNPEGLTHNAYQTAQKIYRQVMN